MPTRPSRNLVGDGDLGSGPKMPSGGSLSGSGSGNSCCDMTMSLKCRCRWTWDLHKCLMISPASAFFLVFLSVYASVAVLYTRLALVPYPRSAAVASLGCQQDDEGSWSIGVFYGNSPFSLKPIETANVWKNETAAWPVANPIVTCASASDAGFPSNFVANPFLYIQADNFYLFYETKNSITRLSNIGVAKSSDNGATWQQLGIASCEDCHFSYPYVFEYHGQIYMMPESSQKGELGLYRALNFPLQWTLEKVVIKRPLVDAVIIHHSDKYWLLGSDRSGFGNDKNGQLEIWYSSSPLGPWEPHKKNPVYNNNSVGARNGGSPFVYKGDLYRLGQDSGESYGRRVRAFRVEVLTQDEFREVEVPLGVEEPRKGLNAWNGARYHHLHVQQLSSGEWVGVMDGDRVLSGDSSHRLILGCVYVSIVVLLVVFLGVLVGAVKCVFPLNCCTYEQGKRSDASLPWDGSSYMLSTRLRRFCSRLNRAISFLQDRVIKTKSWGGKTLLVLIFVSGAVLTCHGVGYLFGGSGADEAYSLDGHYSQFTLLAMTYDARLWNLKMYVKHYSRCPSTREIVVVWNKGTPPNQIDLDSAVPVRIRAEEQNSLNNRFKPDPLIKTRAVLELDDDIMMPCDDVERGFRVWREHPDRIVGFYPRLVKGSPLVYRGEKFARAHKGYNMVLTGAAFVDGLVAFRRYWGDGAEEGREMVDRLFNCEDVLLNYLYANASSGKTVEYVKPTWAIDTSKLSRSAISRDTNAHYGKRSNCLLRFSEMYGSLSDRKWDFDSRKDGWDL